MYGRTPIFVLRDPDQHERMWSCNGCNAPNVTSVLEAGSDRSNTLFRLCGMCTRRLKAAVSDFRLPL